jgi:hypothetical protein
VIWRAAAQVRPKLVVSVKSDAQASPKVSEARDCKVPPRSPGEASAR